MRNIITYFVQIIGVLGIIASIPLYFFAKVLGGIGGGRPASYSKWEIVWQVGSYFLFFIILIIAGWYFRRGNKNA